MNQRNLEKFRSKSTKKLVLRSPSRQNSILRGVDWSEIFCRTCLNTTFGRFLVFFWCISTLLWAITETFFNNKSSGFRLDITVKGWIFNFYSLQLEKIESFQGYTDFKIANLGDFTFINKKLLRSKNVTSQTPHKFKIDEEFMK